MIKGEKYLNELDDFYAASNLFVEYLRYKDNETKTLLTGYKVDLIWNNEYDSLAKKSKKYLENAFRNYIERFKIKFEKGDRNDISLIVHALGVDAFYEKWFIDGLKSLYKKGKIIKLPKHEGKSDYLPLFNDIRKIVKRAKKTNLVDALSFYDNSDKEKTKLFREFPKKKDIFILHFTYYILKNWTDDDREYIFDTITPIKSDKELKQIASRVKLITSNIQIKSNINYKLLSSIFKT